MSYKVLRLPLLTSTQTKSRISLHGPWSTPVETFRDVRVLRSWVEHVFVEHDFEAGAQEQGKWSVLLGFALAVAISAGLWAGLGFFIAHLLK